MMKFNKKIALVSVAALMGIAPVATIAINNNQVVTAATYSQRKLSFKHNSYVYNKKGQRVYKYKKQNAYFKKNSSLKAAIVTSNAKTHYYFYDKKGSKIYLKVYTIKGKKYYSIGSGCYININNLDLVDNSTILTDQNVKVRIDKTVHTNNADGTFNNETLKKGTVITADGFGAIPGGEWIDSGVPQEYYRIAGTKNTYVSAEYTTLLSSVQNGNKFDDLYGTAAEVKGTATSIYNIDGKNMYPGYTTSKHETFAVDAAIYLWVPSEQKAELFYSINTTPIAVYDSKHQQKFERPSEPVFVKASATIISQGVTPTPINTASEAEQDAEPASTSQQSALNEELSKADTVKKSLKYTNASKTNRDTYDKAISKGKTLTDSKTATGAQVILETALIKQAENNLNGAKIKVAYPNFLTDYDKVKIRNAAISATGSNSIQWANHDRELWQMEYGKNDQVSYKKLDLNDYIQADTPEIKNKKGYDSSATPASIEKDLTLAKYAKMLDYDMRKSALVAKKNTYIYQSSTKVGSGSNFNVNKISLKNTGRTIKKGNNIGYYTTLVVKIKGQYYFMIQEKSTYFIKASDVKLDNFSTSATYKKYQNMIDNLMGPTQLIDFEISVQAKKNTTIYNTDEYKELTPSKQILKKGKYYFFVDPYVVKYNGVYYFTGGEEFNDDYDPEGAIRAADVAKVVKGQVFE